VKNERRLQRIDRIFHKVTTTDDPIIRKVRNSFNNHLLCSLYANLLIEQLAKTEGNVYATDSILATLMCSIRSNYSWDIIVQKVGGKLFFDKRDDSEFGTYV
jgi:translation initiation factor 3 subunit D